MDTLKAIRHMLAPPASKGLRLFFTLRAIETVVYLHFYRFNALSVLTSPGWWFVLCLSFLALITGGGFVPTLLMMAAQVFIVAVRFPEISNHQILIAFLDGATLALVAFNSSRPSQVFVSLRSLACALVPLTYFIAALHKSNWDFVNPKVSCATELLKILGSFPKALQFSYVPGLLVVWLALATEWGLGVMTLTRRWRGAGIAFGICFHFFLALAGAGFLDFSLVMLSAYVLLAPEDWYLGPMDSFFENRATRMRMAYQAVLFSLILIAPLQGSNFLFLIYFMLPIAARSFYCAFITRKPALAPAVRFEPWVLFPALALVFLGLSPYFGLLTYPSLSMFSNLSTYRPSWNSMIVPPSFKVFGDEEHVVEIIPGQEPFAQKPHATSPMLTDVKDRKGHRQVVPYLGLLASRGLDGPLDVTFMENGSSHRLLANSQGTTIDGVDVKIPFWRKKIGGFKPVSEKNPQGCSW